MPETPWWERTPEGSPLLLAFVQVLRQTAPGETPQQRDRYRAGVEYVADKSGAAQPLHWRDNDVLLVFQGDDAHTVVTQALSAAEAIRERALVDLSMEVRLAVHATRAEWTPELEKLAPRDVARCGRLARAAPVQAIALTEDVYLVLTDTEQQRFGLLGTQEPGGPAAYVFPASLAAKTPTDGFLPIGDGVYWKAFRRYVDSPEVRRLRYVGFPLQKKQPPSLDIREVFILPKARRLHPPNPEWVHAVMGLPAQAIREAPPSPPQPLSHFLKDHRALRVLGDPGSGKSTVLRWLAVLAAAGPLSWAEHLHTSERLLPVLVSVGRLAQLRSRLGADGSVVRALALYFQDRRVGDAAELASFLERTLEAGECLLLLDGLDEVRSEERSDVLRWLEDFCARYPRNRFVVSARRLGYSGFVLPGDMEVELGDFEEEQIRRYVRAFERACRQWENEGAPDDAGAEQDAARLLEAIFASPRLWGLARNPFLLSALALIHRAEGRLPRHRVQAYEIFSRTLCETWGQARRVVASESSTRDIRYEEEAIPILGELALRMHQEYPTGVAPEDFVLQTLTLAIQERSGGTEAEAAHAAREFLTRAGQDVQILLERGAGQWGFLHLTFQEFFTAVGLLSAEDFERVAFEHLFEPRWEEVIRLGVGYMALIQKRAQATQRFVRRVLRYEAKGSEEYQTSLLGRQIHLAALLASEAGDTLPNPLQEEIARSVFNWSQTMPNWFTALFLDELRLTEFVDRIVDELLRYMSANDENVREHAVHLLSHINNEFSRQALSQASKDPSVKVRRTLVDVVRVSTSEKSLHLGWKELIALTQDQDFPVRVGAILTIGAANEQSKRDEALRLLLNSTDEQTLLVVIISITTYNSTTRRDITSPIPVDIVRSALHKGLSHKSNQVRHAAYTLLAQERHHFPDEEHIHGAHISHHIEQLRFESTQDTTAEDDSDEATLLAFIDQARAADMAGRRLALKRLELSTDERARQTIIDSTQDPEPQIRAEAISCLRHVPTTEARSLVLRALRDPDDEVRMNAQLALSDVDDEASTHSAIIEATRKETNPHVRKGLLSFLWIRARST